MELKSFHQVTFLDRSVGKESTCNAGGPGSIPGSGKSSGEGIVYPLHYSWASLVAQLVKNLLAMWETWVWSLGWEIPWRSERLPTPVFWPGEFHGLYSPWGRKELDMKSDFHFHFHQVTISINERAEIKSLLSKWGQTLPWQANHLSRSAAHITDVSDDATVKRWHMVWSALVMN